MRALLERIHAEIELEQSGGDCYQAICSLFNAWGWEINPEEDDDEEEHG